MSLVLPGATSGSITIDAPAVAGTNTLTLPATTGTLVVSGPKFFGYRSAGNVASTNTVLHNVVVTNVGSCYNSSTGIFTCPVDGYYEVSAGGHGEASTVITLSIQKNGTTVVEEYQNGASYGTVAPTGIVYCSVNDQLKSVVTAGTMWGGNISGLRMSIKLLG